MLRHVDHREVVGDEGPGQAAEGERDEQELRRAAGRARAIQAAAAARGAGQRQRALHQRDEEREDQREMTEFGNHCFTVLAALCASSTACCASGGM
jgi:hypothetical protein